MLVVVTQNPIVQQFEDLRAILSAAEIPHYLGVVIERDEPIDIE